MSDDGLGAGRRKALLLRGIRKSGIVLMYHGKDGRLAFVENAPPDWPPADTILRSGEAALFTEETAAQLEDAKSHALRTGETSRVEVARATEGGGRAWYDLTLEPEIEPNGRIRGLFVTCVNISAVKEREEVLRALLYEVSHRSRNLLAIVLGILGQSARNTEDIASFTRKFRGRVRALARAQDLITQTDWHGAGFRQLLAAELEPVVRVAGAKITVYGPDPMLVPNAALHVGLALHELATNAAQHGRLSDPAASLRVGIVTTPDGAQLCWEETLGAPAAEAAGPTGFGTALLTRAAPAALSGAARLIRGTTGVRYELSIPRDQMVLRETQAPLPPVGQARR